MKIILPAPAALQSLLSDLVCNPVAMRGDRHCALIAAVNARPTPRAIDSIDDSADDDDGDECMPWEAPLYEVVNGLARLCIDGPIVKGYDPVVCWYFGLMSLDRLQAALAELQGRPDVSAVVFKFNSPGGMVTGTPETAAMIAQLGESKLTVGFSSDMACSAAYWLMSACRIALATPSATIGSVGTYLALYDYSEYLAQLGIKLELFRAGNLKGIGLVGKELTAEERQFLQAGVDRINAAFLASVRSSRGPLADSTLQGQWFDGAQAAELGLVDAVIPGESAIFSHLVAGLTPGLSGV